MTWTVHLPMHMNVLCELQGCGLRTTDPNRVLPLDAARELEHSGQIGRLHERYFATVGNATSVNEAKQFGVEIAADLKDAGVNGVVLTST